MDATLPQRQFTDAAGRTWTLPAWKRRQFLNAANTLAEMLCEKHDDEEAARQLPRCLAMAATAPEREARGVSIESFLDATEGDEQIEACRRATVACYGWLIPSVRHN